MAASSSSVPVPYLTGISAVPILPQVIPVKLVEQVLENAGKTSQRRRALPTDFLVYYIIALGLFQRESCREVLRLVQEDLRQVVDIVVTANVAGKSAITQAREKLGAGVLQTLYETLVAPLATRKTRGAWYRQWRIVTIDGSKLATPASVSNTAAFGHCNSKHGLSAFPLAHLVTLVEAGTHCIFRAVIGACNESETALAVPLLDALTSEMLLLSDRLFYGHALWQQALDTGAALVWRVKKNLKLPVEERLPDGSYLSTTTPPKGVAQGHRVRVIEYRLKGHRTTYRLVTNILDYTKAPAQELAALYHERWEHESADLVRQEIYGLLLAHYAARALMHDAALEADEDPDQLSFIHAVRVLRRKLPQLAALPPSAVVALVEGRYCRRIA